MRNIILLSATLLFTQSLFAQQQFKQTPAQQLIANTGEDSLNSGLSAHAKTVISGYGDASYQRNFDAHNATLNLNRAVLFVGHQFNSRIAFFSELEVEDAKIAGGEPGGEISMEQAYLKFSLNPRQYIVAGLFVPRIGILNENHLPINFNGVERPLVETMVIPATWRELGVGFYGQTATAPFTYSIALVSGLNSADFEHGTGIQEGRAEGRLAGANNLAITAAVQYFAGNFKFQVSGYAGGTNTLSPRQSDSLQLNSGFMGTPLYLGEADIQYSNKGFSAKALGTLVAIPDASAINRAYANNVPEQMYGAYAELAYNLLATAHSNRWRSQQFNIFARYEMFDLNAQTPSNGVYDGTEKQSHLIAGFGYLPIPNVVIKADVRLMHTGPQNPDLVLNPNPAALPYNQNNTFLNIGVGYSF
ncbi:MAG: hypothetical protein ACTHJ0_15425 [Flavipsychrobacter sp.]